MVATKQKFWEATVETKDPETGATSLWVVCPLGTSGDEQEVLGKAREQIRLTLEQGGKNMVGPLVLTAYQEVEGAEYSY